MSGPRVAVITGGLTGIGLASARALREAGCRIAVASRRGEVGAVGEAARAELGDDAMIAALDVSDPAAVDAFRDDVTSALGPASILVNAAGIYREAMLDGHDEDAWHDQIDINLTGCFYTTRAFLPAMREAGWGRIVNIASTAGSVGAAGYAAYCASKAGVIALSKCTAIEGAPHGVSCVSISPTWVETPMMDKAAIRHAGPDGDAAAAKAALRETNPQGRLVQAAEVAAVVAFCCSDAAPALTNEDIQVNAGAMW